MKGTSYTVLFRHQQRIYIFEAFEFTLIDSLNHCSATFPYIQLSYVQNYLTLNEKQWRVQNSLLNSHNEKLNHPVNLYDDSNRYCTNPFPYFWIAQMFNERAHELRQIVVQIAQSRHIFLFIFLSHWFLIVGTAVSHSWNDFSQQFYREDGTKPSGRRDSLTIFSQINIRQVPKRDPVAS